MPTHPLTHRPDEVLPLLRHYRPVVAVLGVEQAPEVDGRPRVTRGLVVLLLPPNEVNVLLAVERHA